MRFYIFLFFTITLLSCSPQENNEERLSQDDFLKVLSADESFLNNLLELKLKRYDTLTFLKSSKYAFADIHSERISIVEKDSLSILENLNGDFLFINDFISDPTMSYLQLTYRSHTYINIFLVNRNGEWEILDMMHYPNTRLNKTKAVSLSWEVDKLQLRNIENNIKSIKIGMPYKEVTRILGEDFRGIEILDNQKVLKYATAKSDLEMHMIYFDSHDLVTKIDYQNVNPSN